VACIQIDWGSTGKPNSPVMFSGESRIFPLSRKNDSDPAREW
jgi:hypothetical protein